MKKYKILPYIQLFYYLLTAVWPFVHLESFFAVTGPKVEVWLVKTVSLLLFPHILLIIYVTEIRHSPLIILAILSACTGLAGIDLYYYLKGVIRWVYMIDFVLELVFIIYWLLQVRAPAKP